MSAGDNRSDADRLREANRVEANRVEANRVVAAWRRAADWVRARLGGRRVRRALELLPWTPLGFGVAAVSLVALRSLSYERLDMVWLVVGWAAIGLVLLPLLWVVPIAIYLSRRGQGLGAEEALSLETGQPLDTGYRLPAFRWFPLVSLDLEVMEPAGIRVEPFVRDGRLIERAKATDRGHFMSMERRISVQDVFGLCRLSIRQTSARGLRVHPRLGGLHRLPSLTSFAAGDELPHPLGAADGDRVELSRYVPGDPARFIHWKVYARTRKLMVRRPERALSKARRVAAFYVAGPDDDASAALCRLALMRGLLGTEWRFATAGHAAGTDNRDEALSWLLQSAQRRHAGAEGLGAFLRSVAQGGPTSVMLFVPARTGPWLSEVADVVRGRQVRVLLALDRLADEVDAGPLHRWLLTRTSQPHPTRRELDRVVQTLMRAGCAVAVYDRAQGTTLRDRPGAGRASAAADAAVAHPDEAA